MSSPQVIVHRCGDGDRWDLLAWKYYGDASLFAAIIMANPTIPIAPVLKAGQTLMIPIIRRQSVVSSDLPPWKRIAS